MTIADRILAFLQDKRGRTFTAAELAKLVFGYSSPRVLYTPLFQLFKEGKLLRDGGGGEGAEFRYRLPPFNRRI
jgi:hypothetical protein